MEESSSAARISTACSATRYAPAVGSRDQTSEFLAQRQGWRIPDWDTGFDDSTHGLRGEVDAGRQQMFDLLPANMFLIEMRSRAYMHRK
jgi:hypothetical protein